MKKQHLLIYLLLWIAATTFTACQKERQEIITSPDETLNVSDDVQVPETEQYAARSGQSLKNNSKTFYGPAVRMGNGYTRSWINIRKADCKPLSMGIEMTHCSLQNLPQNPLDFAASTFVLPLHPKAKSLTPFDHITLNWNPQGHEPEDIYDVPHFDMHFYKVSLAEEMAITGIPTAPPSPGFLPASYVIQGATVPQMGTHWLDPASPELPPTMAPFTYTFIYGSNNGGVHFLEPMITRAFILGGSYIEKAIPQPVHFSPSNTNYPTMYRIWRSAANNRHYVALTDFEWR